MRIFRTTVSGKCPPQLGRWRNFAAPGILAASLALALLALSGCRSDVEAASEIEPDHLFMFAPISAPAPAQGVMALRVNLGRRLYYDTHLSENNSLSCNSCHDLARYGVDPGNAVSLGHNKNAGTRNSPTVYNAVLEFAQFWDGRAPTLAAQASGPMMNPVEMGMSGPDAVIAILRANPTYVQMFKKAYPESKDPITMDNVTDAIATFESGLVTPSRWDDYLRGDSKALSEEEKEGLQAYLDAGCASCHAGAAMGGNSYQKLGVFRDWPDQKSDRGRFDLTHEQSDAMYFKVPVLRNIAETGPWFQNGKVQSLDQAVRLMGEYQTGQKLSAAQVQQIVVFLRALTGPIPTNYIQPPSVAASPEAATGSAGEARQHRSRPLQGE
ncbi:MAG: cytochrome-c peroxidase [Acidobacteriota bacterium]